MAAAALLTTVGLACSDLGASRQSVSAGVPPFPGSASTLNELGSGVLSALAAADLAALARYRLTESEHNDIVWPELPASAPEVNFPVGMAWTNIQTRNQSAVRRILPLYEGREPSFRATACRGEAESFATFVVLTDCWVQFEFEMDGVPKPFEVQLFKDVLVRGGGHRIFRYYDEEPRPLGSEHAD